ncbi:hypothetical protein C5B96_13255 [Subtercola sp. Z020]|uniref:hypothetical protein n=1 Tax=Subtercola sp. Z020 TaxID=2080582 RepID=UPI000CE8494B|nr:hypothetical protein [Subtercola sp. Z020]PPF79229.1 hypothetical protein C5B96_13255 [Subtercola sp. Z020]
MSAFSRSALRVLAATGVSALLVAAPLAGAATATAATAIAATATAGARSATVQAVDVPGSLAAPAVDEIADDGVPVFVNVQVPVGLSPTTATATLTPLVPAAPGSTGVVLVTVRGEVRQSVDPTAPAAISIPLTGDDVVNGQVSIGYTYQPAAASTPDAAAVCLPPATASVSLSETAVSTEGQATAPTTLADFFSPALAAVSVTIPDAASNSVRQAGLAAVGALAHAYPAPVELSLTTVSDAAHAVAVDAAQGRVVTFAPADATAADAPVTTALSTDAAGVPVLTISGPEAALPAAGAALASDYLALAGASSTTGLSQTGTSSNGDTATLSPTFRDLGAGAQIALAAAGQPDAVVNVSQSAFGGPIGDASVHIVGMHSAVPDSIVATMNVYWNDYLIGSEVLGGTSAFDLTLPVASTRLTAANALKVSLSTQAATGDCVPASNRIPVELFVDNGASTVTGTRGQSLDAGFQRFPQALGQTLPVAFGTSLGDQAAVASAGDIVASLQRNSTVQLAVTVPSLEEFRGSTQSGLVVGATSDDSDALKAPLRLDAFTAIDSKAVTFGVGTTLPYAAFESFDTNGRDILLLGGWSPDDQSATDPLQVQAAHYTLTNPGAWFGLTGDVLVAQSSLTDPVALSSNAIVPQTAVTSDYNSYALWAVIVIIVLILAAAIGEATRRRRRKKLAAYVDAQLEAERDRTSNGQGPTQPPASGTTAD